MCSREDAASGRPTILVLGPDRCAVSGVSTHLNQLFASPLAGRFHLVHVETGSEGRPTESRAQRLARAVVSPLDLAWSTLRLRPHCVYVNSAMEPKAFWRDAVYLVVARALGRTTILEVHGGLSPTGFVGRSRLRAAAHRRILRLADRVVLLSRADRQAYADYDPELATVVIPNAVHLADTPAPPAKPVLDDTALRLVSIGRLVEAKGVFDSVRAVRLLKDQGVYVELDIAGSGPDEQALRACIRDEGVHDRVRILGVVAGAAKDRLMREADVLVFPSHREGMPYALLEAMGAGAVPVTCDVGAIGEVLGTPPCGVLVPPRDPHAVACALLELHRDRDRTRTMSAEGYRRVVEHYPVTRMAADLGRLFEEL
jgi:glycosyltransferase involved in cell wall biosynthesis